MLAHLWAWLGHHWAWLLAGALVAAGLFAMNYRRRWGARRVELQMAQYSMELRSAAEDLALLVEAEIEPYDAAEAEAVAAADEAQAEAARESDAAEAAEAEEQAAYQAARDQRAEAEAEAESYPEPAAEADRDDGEDEAAARSYGDIEPSSGAPSEAEPEPGEPSGDGNWRPFPSAPRPLSPRAFFGWAVDRGLQAADPPPPAEPPVETRAPSPPPLAETPLDLVDIFYGTDRAPSDGPQGHYLGERGRQLRVGVAVVSVPRDREPGTIPRPRKLLMFSLERENPLKHFVVQSSEELDEAAFQSQLNRRQDEAPEAPALLFVHGFNTSFDGGLYRAAQLAVDLAIAGPMLHYSWPSRGAFTAYDYDSESVKQSRRYFCEFLDLIAATSVMRLNIIAHSKGNELLLEALSDHPRNRLTRVHQVVLASPDVDCDFATNVIPGVSRKVKGMTLYACAEDIALQTSKAKAGGVARAGHLLADGYPLIAQGLDSIDASSCALRLSEFNHNSVVADTVLRYDLARLLASGQRPPDSRSPSITPKVCPRGDYWFLQPR